MSLTVPNIDKAQGMLLSLDADEAYYKGDYEEAYEKAEKGSIVSVAYYDVLNSVNIVGMAFKALGVEVTGEGRSAKARRFYGDLGTEIEKLRSLKKTSIGNFSGGVSENGLDDLKSNVLMFKNYCNAALNELI